MLGFLYCVWSRKTQAWNEGILELVGLALPWLIRGDFNAIRNIKESAFISALEIRILLMLLEYGKKFDLVQLFSFPKELTEILSADQSPYFFNFDREKAIRLLEAQKRKGRYAVYMKGKKRRGWDQCR